MARQPQGAAAPATRPPVRPRPITGTLAIVTAATVKLIPRKAMVRTSYLRFDSLHAYCEAMKANPSVVIVRTPGGCDYVERQCRRESIQVDVFNFEGDYYSLPNLVPMLSRPSKLELLMDIMEYPLPQRKSA